MKFFLFLLPLLLLLNGCVTTSPEPNPAILRVGITPNSPPLIFKQGGRISGAEADFARIVSAALGRELVFVEVPWDKQIDHLERDKTDIVMSGMTVTSVREYRVNFTKPYMISGLTALFRRSDYAASGLVPSVIRHQNGNIGVIDDTTGEMYATSIYTHATIIPYKSKHSAVKALKDRKVGMIIYDAPMIWWIAAENEADLVAFPELMNNEPLAWAISKHNLGLLDEVNAILDEMKEDGSGKRVLENWFPRM